MKQLTLYLLVLILVFACGPSEPETKSLFNGVDLTGWHVDIPAKDVNPDTADAFIVRDQWPGRVSKLKSKRTVPIKFQGFSIVGHSNVFPFVQATQV